MPIIYQATCDNYFIVKSLLKSNVAKVILLNYLLHRACFIQFNAHLVQTSKSKNCKYKPSFLVIFALVSFNSNVFYLVHHCVKSVRIRSYSGPHFPAFGLNTERYCGKMRTRITPNTDTFYAVHLYSMIFCNWFIFECFVPNIWLLLKTCTYEVVDFTVLAYFALTLDAAKFLQ